MPYASFYNYICFRYIGGQSNERNNKHFFFVEHQFEY